MDLTDKEIAKKIVEYFQRKYSCKANYEDLKELIHVGLFGAFAWAQTLEGYAFWYNLYHSRNFCDERVFRSFMINNYIINEPNFIEIEFFI